MAKLDVWVWVVLGIGGCIVISVVLTVLWLICRVYFMRRRRREYERIRQDSGMFYDSMELQRQSLRDTAKDNAQYNCVFYLRSSLRYSLIEPLPDIGSRVERDWFIIKQDNPPLEDHLLLTLTRRHTGCTVDLINDKRTLNQLFVCLQHPYVQPVIELDYIVDKSLVVAIQPLSTKGSLRDFIYRARPFAAYGSKYTSRGHPMTDQQIGLFGRQILEAIVFLCEKGIPPGEHLHSGNIILHSPTLCRLTGYENNMLGYKSRTYSVIKHYIMSKHESKLTMDVLMFGRLLFEMAAGYELVVTATPQSNDMMALTKRAAIVDILKRIFMSHDDEQGRPCDLQTIMEMSFFQHKSPPELSSWTLPQVPMTPEGKALLMRTRISTTSLQPSHSLRRSEPRRSRKSRKSSSVTSATPEKYPVTPLVSPNTSTSGISSLKISPKKTPSATPTPQQPVPKLPPVPETRGASPDKDRGALLGDIRRGTKLKRTVTNDRSAPQLT